jgi:hypothetical protein
MFMLLNTDSCEFKTANCNVRDRGSIMKTIALVFALLGISFVQLSYADDADDAADSTAAMVASTCRANCSMQETQEKVNCVGLKQGSDRWANCMQNARDDAQECMQGCQNGQ